MPQNQSLSPTVPSVCLARSLGRHLVLTDEESNFIAETETAPETVSKGYDILRPGVAMQALHLVAEGWAIARATTPAGKGHAYRLFLPGDLIGLSEIAMSRARQDVRMQTVGALHRIARTDLTKMFQRHPRIGALLTALVSVDAIALRDHAVGLAAMDGETRLKTFLLQLRARLHKAGVGTGDRLRVPLNQSEIGELTGMTPIYVNRLLRRWVHAETLSIERPYFHLRAREMWESETGFVDSFEPVDTSWFPSA